MSEPKLSTNPEGNEQRLAVLQELADLSQKLDLDRLTPKLAGMDEIVRINKKYGLYEWKLDDETDNSL